MLVVPLTLVVFVYVTPLMTITTVLLDKYTGYNEAVQNICESSDKNYIYISTATGWDINTDTRSLTFITVQRTSTTTVSSNLLYTHTSYSSGDANGYKAGGLLCKTHSNSNINVTNVSAVG